jgi:hypothetical protein
MEQSGYERVSKIVPGVVGVGQGIWQVGKCCHFIHIADDHGIQAGVGYTIPACANNNDNNSNYLVD